MLLREIGIVHTASTFEFLVTMNLFLIVFLTFFPNFSDFNMPTLPPFSTPHEKLREYLQVTELKGKGTKEIGGNGKL